MLFKRESLPAKHVSTLSAQSAVDKVMFRDIRQFISRREERADTLREPPRVVSSPSVAVVPRMPVSTSTESYPRRHVLVGVDHATRIVGDSVATDGEDHKHELYLRDSLELDPRIYTGSAELRGGASPTPPMETIHVSRTRAA